MNLRCLAIIAILCQAYYRCIIILQMTKKIILISLYPIYMYSANIIDWTTDISYFWMNFLQFLIPITLMIPFVYKELLAKWKPFLVTWGSFILITTLWEFASTENDIMPSFDIWSFDTDIVAYVFGVPIEEFIWWYASAPFMMISYLHIKKAWELNGK